MADLRFAFPPAESADLIFGQSEPSVVPRYDVTLSATLPGLTFSARNIPDAKASIAATLPGLSLSASAAYESRAARPTTANTVAAHQNASHQPAGTEGRHQYATHLPSGAAPAWQSATHLSTLTAAAHQDAIRARNSAAQAFQAAQRLTAADITAPHQDAIRIKIDRLSLFQGAIRTDTNATTARHQDGLRHARRYAISDFQAAAKSGANRTSKAGAGKALPKVFFSRFQEAIAPGIGAWSPPEPPIPEPCYAPSPRLRFSLLRATDGNLVFVCDKYAPPVKPPIIIPVQRVYIVLNEVLLVRVVGAVPIPATQMSVNFDCDSWLPSFSANIPASSLDAVMPDPTPVEVEISINGVAFRFFVERITRNRAFAQNTVSIGGRGIASELDAPYAAASQHTNTQAMTAQQIINDALAYTDYTQSWNITDWLIPANTFSLYGTPAQVAGNVADAAGAVLQADWAQRDLRMLPRYPVKPWEWSSATPEYVIPAAVAQSESLEWVEKPAYNVVYISGVQTGVLGQVKITGTAGDKPAPMVTHPLITHADAARQKGIAILSDTGRKAMMQISLPVLDTLGVVDVCRLIEFHDGNTMRRGIVRANAISVNFPTVRQTLTIEAAA